MVENAVILFVLVTFISFFVLLIGGAIIEYSQDDIPDTSNWKQSNNIITSIFTTSDLVKFGISIFVGILASLTAFAKS